MLVINQLLTAGLWTNILWSRDLEPVQATNKERPISPSAWTVHLPFMLAGIVHIVHFNISCFAGVQVAPCLSRWLMIWCWFCPLMPHLRTNYFADCDSSVSMYGCVFTCMPCMHLALVLITSNSLCLALSHTVLNILTASSVNLLLKVLHLKFGQDKIGAIVRYSDFFAYTGCELLKSNSCFSIMISCLSKFDFP